MKQYFPLIFAMFMIILLAWLSDLKPMLSRLSSIDSKPISQNKTVLLKPISVADVSAFMMQSGQSHGLIIQSLQPATFAPILTINLLATGDFPHFLEFIQALMQYPYPIVLKNWELQMMASNVLQMNAQLVVVGILKNQRQSNIFNQEIIHDPFVAKTIHEELKTQEVVLQTELLVTRLWQMHYAKAEDMAHLLQDDHHSLLSSRGHVHADTRTNILCIQDISAHIKELDRIIKKLDIPVQQVLIEARLVSMDSDFERQLGINFMLHDAVEPTHYSLAIAKLANQDLLDVRLAALENEGHGELLSSPSLFTANQQTAFIESGEEIPYQEVSKSGATSVAFKKAVLSLKVTPQIMPGNRVLLQLQVNQDKPTTHLILGVPTITTRQINTSVMVKSGQVIVLGGIYELNKEQNQQRIPFLGKIPLVGWLFTQQNNIENKRELLIFVIPKVL